MGWSSLIRARTAPVAYVDLILDRHEHYKAFVKDVEDVPPPAETEREGHP